LSQNEPKAAKLILEDNSSFEGIGFGAFSSVSGEVVFNTGMVGYPESLTDPSYRGQILVLTYPLIGNYGVPGKEKDCFGLLKNFESSRIQITGLIVADYSYEFNHWQATESLGEWLQEENIPGITAIDCRALTKKLREKGVMLGKIVFDSQELGFDDPNKKNLVAEVSCRKPVLYENGKRTIALLDCGAKDSIIRSFLQRNVSVLRVPWDYNLFNGKHDFEAVFVSNGPGDPKTVQTAIDTVRKSLEYSMPTFGICLGNQILGLAAGADTFKLKYGHRSQNQPCQIVGTKQCYITSQNHGFAVDEKNIPRDWQPWFRNLNDGTNEGIKHKSKPFMSVQFHPEANPGPVDTGFLFDWFLKKVKEAKK